MAIRDVSGRDGSKPPSQWTTLARFGAFALQSHDLDEILNEACRLVAEALGTDLAKVTELQEDGQTLLARAGVGWRPDIVGEVTLQATNDSSEGHALKTGEPTVSPDIDRETRFRYPALLINHGIKAVASVLIIGGKDKPPFGILQVHSRTPRQFTEDDVDLLRGYANLLAFAVDRLHAKQSLSDEQVLLRESLNRQKAALQTGLIGFFEWHVPTDMITGDRHFASFYGLDPEATAAGVPLGMILDLVHPADRGDADANVSTALASAADYTREFRLVPAAGEMRWLLVRGHCHEHEGGRPLRYTGTAVDITASKASEAALWRSYKRLEARVAERTRELTQANAKLQAEAADREQVEEALRQSQKMEAVGQLTGGLAHDFNNILATITGNLELVQVRTAQGRMAGLGRHIEASLGAANRAATLIHRLLAFSRRQTLDPKPTDVNRLVGGMAELFRRTVGPAIQVRTSLAAALWPVLCDRNQLEAALLNLVINARDAMPDGGHLLIDTANTVLCDRRGVPKEHPPQDVAPGDYVVLSIADTGAGMAADVIARAFEPFFTTKPIGQGTGLGLSMVYGFVRQSGGQVHLRSEPGQGTTLAIYLPRHLGAATGAGEPDTVASSLHPTVSSVVLVVEDDLAVRMIVREVLSELGCTVLEAGCGRSGLDIVESRVHVDLLLTDVGLPGGMNGWQLADAARQRRPDLKVLFITGFAEGEIIGEGQVEQGMQVLTKPFAITTLADRVQDILRG